MQVDNNNRPAVVVTSTVLGAGAGVAAGYFLPVVNSLSEPNSDLFVKEVMKEVSAARQIEQLVITSAYDELDTISKGSVPTKSQKEKFLQRFGEYLELDNESVAKMKKNEFKETVEKAIDSKLDLFSENVDIKVTDDGVPKITSYTNSDEAKGIIKKGFKGRKLNKSADKSIIELLESAMQQVKNKRMLWGGIATGILALTTSLILTCQKKN